MTGVSIVFLIVEHPCNLKFGTGNVGLSSGMVPPPTKTLSLPLHNFLTFLTSLIKPQAYFLLLTQAEK